MTSGLTWDEFDSAFQRFADSPTSTRVYRWEARDYYSIPADEPSLVAFREGQPRPERSVRTSLWLARIATSTVAGKRWIRVRRVVDDEYFRWELLAYVESQAAGERVLMYAGGSKPINLPDVWVFDGERTEDRYAIVMHYADDGTVEGLEYVADPSRVASMLAQIRIAALDTTPLNTYLAHRREAVSGAH